MFYYFKLLIISILTMSGFIILRPVLASRSKPRFMFLFFLVGVLIIFSMLAYFSIIGGKFEDIDQLFSNHASSSIKKPAYTKLFRLKNNLIEFEKIIFGEDTVKANLDNCNLTIKLWSTILSYDSESLKSSDYILELNSKCHNSSVARDILIDSANILFGAEDSAHRLRIDSLNTKRLRQSLGVSGRTYFDIILIPDDVTLVTVSIFATPLSIEDTISMGYPLTLQMYKYVDSTLEEVKFPKNPKKT